MKIADKPRDIESFPEDDSEVELQRYKTEGDGIVVKSDFDQRIEQIREGIEAEVKRMASNKNFGNQMRINRAEGD